MRLKLIKDSMCFYLYSTVNFSEHPLDVKSMPSRVAVKPEVSPEGDAQTYRAYHQLVGFLQSLQIPSVRDQVPWSPEMGSGYLHQLFPLRRGEVLKRY